MSTNPRWYRQHFYDHPELPRNSPSAYANFKERRVKVACKLCFNERVMAERERDEEELRNGQRLQARSHADIITWLWAFEARDPRGPCPWIQGRSETLVRHLKNCQHQPPDIRNLATAMCIEKGWNRARGQPSPPEQPVRLDNLYRFPTPSVSGRPDLHIAVPAGPSISLNSPPHAPLPITAGPSFSNHREPLGTWLQW